MAGLLLGAALCILLAAALAVYRILAGPVVVDRVLGLNVAGTKTLAVLLLTGFLFDRVEFFLDIAFVYGMTNFIGVLALSNYFERKGLRRRAGE